VDRFEIEKEPRSFVLRFEFGPNKWFEDKMLEKRFWYRRSKGTWQGLVSEPVKIHWQKDKDLTNGITDASFALWQAFQAAGDESAEGYQHLKQSPEWKKVVEAVESTDLSGSSFFTLFSYISSYRWVSEQESRAAYEAEAERRSKRSQGESVEEPAEDSVFDEDELVVCPHGEDLALGIADEIYPNAIKFFSTLRQRRRSTIITDIFLVTAQDREEGSLDDSDAEDSDGSRDSDSSHHSDDEEITTSTIRSLVSSSRRKRRQEGSGSASPPRSSRIRTAN
jgi:nucleosome assembly protein (NAP)